MNNRLFVVDKPMFVSSNGYMNHIKRKYGTKKVGFSGTLDPFATGGLIVATGQYTKLFQYLKKTPKLYSATLWLGATSKSLDIENILSIDEVEEFSIDEVYRALEELRGEISYYPPKFSAKRVAGKRAYQLARVGEEVELKRVTSTVYDIHLIRYNHPFIHFEIMVSEGSYIRALANIVAQKLGVAGTLSSLRRVYEGKFHFEHEKPLDPLKFLNIPQNIYLGDCNYLELGKKLDITQFEIGVSGIYWVECENFFSIIEINGNIVKYKLNRIQKLKK